MYTSETKQSIHDGKKSVIECLDSTLEYRLPVSLIAGLQCVAMPAIRVSRITRYMILSASNRLSNASTVNLNRDQPYPIAPLRVGRHRDHGESTTGLQRA